MSEDLELKSRGQIKEKSSFLKSLFFYMKMLDYRNEFSSTLLVFSGLSYDISTIKIRSRSAKLIFDTFYNFDIV